MNCGQVHPVCLKYTWYLCRTWLEFMWQIESGKSFDTHLCIYSVGYKSAVVVCILGIASAAHAHTGVKAYQIVFRETLTQSHYMSAQKPSPGSLCRPWMQLNTEKTVNKTCSGVHVIWALFSIDHKLLWPSVVLLWLCCCFNTGTQNIRRSIWILLELFMLLFVYWCSDLSFSVPVSLLLLFKLRPSVLLCPRCCLFALVFYL